MKFGRYLLLGFSVLLTGCQSTSDRTTIGELNRHEPDLVEVPIDDSLLRAMAGYRQFLDETPSHRMAPEAMRRLADLQIEKEFGVIGDSNPAEIIELPAPVPHQRTPQTQASTIASLAGDASLTENPSSTEDDAEFEARATRPDAFAVSSAENISLPDGGSVLVDAGLQEAIQTYEQILADYPWYERNDQVLYQMARAYDELGKPDEAMQVVERLISEYPNSKYVDEVFFRRGEYYFVRKKYLDAEEAYLAVVGMGEHSEFYELALYKLGWSFYKQELYDEALHQYIALLDYKLSTGHDFDAAVSSEGEGEERRVADTFRVISLSFSNLGGADVVRDYFQNYGTRSFEDRIYRNLAEFHFDKRRFNDAAETYRAFVDLYPYHKVSPHFGMRVSEIYAEGNFPLLVVESKKDFANRYGVNADYWQYFDQSERGEVLDYLKSNLIDLANHYHALYQEESRSDEQPENYAQALRWYDDFLTSFPEDDQSPGINFQLADLLLEHGDFSESARQYERTAYEYPSHQKASEAGYAAIYAHRQYLEVADDQDARSAKLATVESSLRFAATFSDHEHAAAVLGAATEDLYALEDHQRAIASGRWLINGFDNADEQLREKTWLIIAHASFDTSAYADAEEGYSQVLSLTDTDGEERQALTDNLAAAIYKQGEQARETGEYALASQHFLRVKEAAPESAIRASAEYDAASALLHLEDWLSAADVLNSFRKDHPDHELNHEATRQLAATYEKAGALNQAAKEYEQVALDAEDPEMRREALLVAGDLYEQSAEEDEVLRIYTEYLAEFAQPLDVAVETRFKVAEIYKKRGADSEYRDQLETIVEIDRGAGAERTDRIRYLAAQSALVLTVGAFDDFTSLELTQPFEESLAEKKAMMNRALTEFEALVAYEVGEVTAAATYYLAEIYRDFSQSLISSERPVGLDASELLSYEMVIEEEAFPFEEQAIAVHQENVALLRSGVFNQWVQKSLDQLAALMPARFARQERSGGFVGNIEQYAYLAPVVPDTETESPAQELGLNASGSESSPRETGPIPEEIASANDA